MIIISLQKDENATKNRVGVKFQKLISLLFFTYMNTLLLYLIYIYTVSLALSLKNRGIRIATLLFFSFTNIPYFHIHVKFTERKRKSAEGD
jgi:hypothetical protein